MEPIVQNLQISKVIVMENKLYFQYLQGFYKIDCLLTRSEENEQWTKKTLSIGTLNDKIIYLVFIDKGNL